MLLKCHECVYLMFDYIDGKLSAEVRADMEKHIKECSECAERLLKMEKQYEARQEEEKLAGMFWQMFRPSGGFKRFFIIGAIFTFILVLALISIKMRKPLFRLF